MNPPSPNPLHAPPQRHPGVSGWLRGDRRGFGGCGHMVPQGLMTTFGGAAYAGRMPFERYFRDARAGLVMGMANNTAYQNMVPLLSPDRA